MCTGLGEVDMSVLIILINLLKSDYGHGAGISLFDRKVFFSYGHNAKNLFFYHKKYINLVNFQDLKMFLRKILCYDNDFYGHKKASLYFDRKQCK